MRALLGLAGAAMAFAMLTPTTAAVSDDDDGDPVIGRAIYMRDNCYGCHGNTGAGGDGPNIRDNQPNDDEIREAVLNGRPTGMPSFAGLLNENDVQDLIAYIDSLRSDEEPVSTHWWEFIPTRFPAVRCCDVPERHPPHGDEGP